MIENGIRNIVIDLGSQTMRIGHDQIEAASCEVDAVVGKPRYKGMHGMDVRKVCYGQEALERAPVLDLNYPIRSGVVQDVDQAEGLLNHAIYNELRSETDTTLLMNLSYQTPTVTRAELIDVLFAKFDFRSVVLLDSCLAISAAQGVDKGVTLDIGHGGTRCYLVRDGRFDSKLIQISALGGEAITLKLIELLGKTGQLLTPRMEFEIATSIKHQYCCLTEGKFPEDFDSIPWVLPDYNTISIRRQEFQTPNLLFACTDDRTLTIPTMLRNLFEADASCRKLMLAGGTVKTNGFRVRIRKEIDQLALKGLPVEIETNQKATHISPSLQVILGLKVISGLLGSTDTSPWTRIEYGEEGSIRLAQKLFQSQIITD